MISTCLVVNPIKVGIFAFLFNCMLVGPTSDSMTVLTITFSNTPDDIFYAQHYS